MYENHRDDFGRRRFENERRNREQRRRPGDDHYRREATEQRGYQDQPGGAEDDYSGDSWFDLEQRSSDYGQGRDDDRQPARGYRGRGQEHIAHDYGRADRGHPGDSSYFTGTQGSWAMPSPNRGSAYRSAYGSGGFGADYREHGYDRGGEHRGFLDKAGDEIASWFGDEGAARRREQDHRGRGPKNYVRSDERIRDDANDRLTEDWRLDASDITVTVESGEVTLDGTVPDRAAKRRAEDLIEDISGVKHVQNNLRVAQASIRDQDRSSSDDGRMISTEGGTLPASSARTNQTT